MGLRHRAVLSALALGLLTCLLPSAGGSSVQPASKAKARDQLADSPRPHSKKVVRKRSTRAAKAAATGRARRSRRARAYRHHWAESSYADSSFGDRLDGEDLVVRDAAVAALGALNGSVVVVDPNSGRILSIVNQKLGLSHAEQPCSTIKLPVAVGALNEGLITRDTQVRLNRRCSMNLTEALAHSNNRFFEVLGQKMGFAKFSQYATELGLGELAGYNIPGEQPGVFPGSPARGGGVAKMSSYGLEILITPVQLAALAATVANGGTLYYLQYPRTPEEVENFRPRVKRQLDIRQLLPDLREGMMAAVDHGTGHRAAQPYETVLGKTGTCSRDNVHLGWFASYEGREEGKLVVVVHLRGGHLSGGGEAAEVAGRVYRNLHERNYAYLKSAPALPVATADNGR